MQVIFNNKPLSESLDSEYLSIQLPNSTDKVICEHTKDNKVLNIFNIEDNNSFDIEQTLLINGQPLVNLLYILVSLDINIDGCQFDKEGFITEFAETKVYISQFNKRNNIIYYTMQFVDKEDNK